MNLITKGGFFQTIKNYFSKVPVVEAAQPEAEDK